MTKTAIRILACLLVAVIVKAYISFHYAPKLSGDMRAYVTLAEQISAGAPWLSNSPMLEKDEQERYVWHISHRRMLGYPTFLSILMDNFGENWRTALSLIVSAGTITCALVVFLIVHRWTNGAPVLAEIGFFAPVISQRLFWDVVPMTDSLNSTLFTLALFAVLYSPKTDSERYFWFLAGGMLVAGAFLLRNPTAYFYLLSAPMIVIRFLGEEKVFLKSALALFLFLVPLQLTKYGYESWNEQRTGKAFVTTAAREAFAISLGGIYQIDKSALPADGLVGKVALETGSELEGRTFSHPNLAIWEFSRIYNEKLWINARIDALTASRLTTAYFIQLVSGNPLLALRRMIMGGLVSDYHFRQFYDGYKFWPFLEQDNTLRPLGRTHLDSAVINGFFGSYTKPLQRFISVILGLGFFVGIPAILLRRKDFPSLSTDKILMMGGVLLFYLGVNSMHSLINMEFRFMLVILPTSTAMALVAIWALIGKLPNGRLRAKEYWRRVIRKN